MKLILAMFSTLLRQARVMAAFRRRAQAAESALQAANTLAAHMKARHAVEAQLADNFRALAIVLTGILEREDALPPAIRQEMIAGIVSPDPYRFMKIHQAAHSSRKLIAANEAWVRARDAFDQAVPPPDANEPAMKELAADRDRRKAEFQAAAAAANAVREAFEADLWALLHVNPQRGAS
jgi:hypothetical protein